MAHELENCTFRKATAPRKWSRNGVGEAERYLCLAGILLLLLSAVGGASAAPFDHKYQEIWAEADSELKAERWQAAAPLYERVISEFENQVGPAKNTSSKQKADLARIRNDYGLVLLRLAWLQPPDSGEGATTLEASRLQLELSMKAGLELGAADILGDVYDNLAGWNFVKGEESAVIENLRQALQFYRQAEDPEGLTRVSNNLGMMHRKLGELRAAQSAFHSGLDFSRQGGTDIEKGHLHYNTSVLYRALGDLDQAKFHAEESLMYSERAGMARAAMLSRVLLATQLRDLGNPAAALELHTAAVEYFKAEGLSNYEATTRQEIVVDLIELGETDAAYSASRKLLDDESKFDAQSSKLGLYANHARLLMQLGRPAEAIEFATEKLQGRKGHARDPFGQIDLLDALRSGFAAIGAVDQAVTQAIEIFSLIEDQRTEFESFRLGPLWSAKTSGYYARHIEFLLKLDQRRNDRALPHLAFETIERARAASFRQRRRESILNRQQNNPSVSNEWRDLIHSLQSQQSASDSEIDSLASERRFNAAREAFFASSGVTIDVTQLPLISIEDVQTRLASNQVIVSFFSGKQDVWRYVIQPSSWAVTRISDRALLDSQIGAALKELTTLGGTSDSAISELSTSLLGDVLLESGVDQVLFVPGDGMHGLPFSVLRVDGGAINDIASAIVIPSLSEYYSPSPEGETGDRLELAVFANPHFDEDAHAGLLSDRYSEFRNWSAGRAPLVHSADEAKALQSLFGPDKSMVFTGVDANRNNLFSERVRRAKILHLATHGYFNVDLPDLIGLAFAKDGASDDGMVTLAEIAAEDIRAELVVISACDTARGRQIASEGEFSLTRTFLSQGVDSVISTLWPVSDRATAIFMREFYDNYKNRGLEVAESLRFAQLALQKDPRYKDPFFWGAYVLTSAKPIRSMP